MSTSLLKKTSARTVFANTRALLLIQAANQFLPLILIPYLARVLGAHNYGVVSFGLALLVLANLVTDYGFNLSATLEISRSRDDKNHVNKVIGSVFLAKVLLICIVAPFFIGYALYSIKYQRYSTYLLLLIFPLIAQTYQPTWFFQGIEKISYLAAATLFSRIVYVLMVFLLVKTAADIPLIAALNGIAHICLVVIAMFLMIREGYRPIWPGFEFAIRVLRQSTPFFWSRAAVSTYTAGGAMFLGLFSAASQVAYYSAADQIYKGTQALFAPLSQALYPNMVRTYNFGLLFKVVRWATLICLLGLIFGGFAGQTVISTLFGQAFNESFPVLLILLGTLLVNTPSVLIGYPLLGALGQVNLANRSVLIAGALQVVLLTTWYYLGWNSAFDIACTVFLVELLVLLLRLRWGTIHYKYWLRGLKTKL